MNVLYKITGFAALPHVMVIAGLFLVVASGYELGETLFSFSEEMKGEHGTFIYGLIILLKSLGEMHEGIESVGEGTGGGEA